MSTEENKGLVRRLVAELWNKHNAGAIGDFFGPDLQEEISGHYGQLLTGFPDVHVSIEDLLAEGDKVVARLLIRGTHTGPFAGQPATGRRASWVSVRTYRVAGGKVVETWALQDRLGLLQQLGVVSAPEGVNWASGQSTPDTTAG